MAGLLFVLLLVVPVVELYVIVQVAQGIGVIETLVVLIAVSIAGAWLLKQQGLQTWVRTQRALSEGRMPHRELIDGALILVGGTLLLTPGFVTDAVGLLFLLPPTRPVLKRGAARLFAGWAARRVAPGMRIYRGAVVASKVNRSRTKTRREESPPRPALPPDEDDSPDRA